MWYLHSPSLPWPRTYLRHMYFLQILLATHFQERQCDWEWLCGNFEEQDLALAALMFCEDFERPWKGHCFGELVQRLRKLCTQRWVYSTGKLALPAVNAGTVREPGQSLLGARTKWSKGCPSHEDKFKHITLSTFPPQNPEGYLSRVCQGALHP